MYLSATPIELRLFSRGEKSPLICQCPEPLGHAEQYIHKKTRQQHKDRCVGNSLVSWFVGYDFSQRKSCDLQCQFWGLFSLGFHFLVGNNFLVNRGMWTFEKGHVWSNNHVRSFVFRTLLDISSSQTLTFFFKFDQYKMPVIICSEGLKEHRYPTNDESTTQCLKFTEKVSFNIASKASYIYI